jgi:hypothetical protein
VRLRVRFVDAPDAEARRALRDTLLLVAGGAARWRSRGELATIDWPDEAPLDLGALDAQQPIAEVDRGDGFAPYDAASDEAADDDLPTAPAPGERPPSPAEVPPPLVARYVFDDHLVAAPRGRTLAFVRDAGRCHFATLEIIDADGRARPPMALPVLTARPRVAWAPDEARAIVAGPEHLLALVVDDQAAALHLLAHHRGEDGFDVAWLDERRVAVVASRWLRLFALDDNHAPRLLGEAACAGGRLVRALDGGTLLVVGTDGGTALVEVGADHRLALVRRTWRSLVDVWERDGRAYAQLASGDVVELVGLAPLRARARPGPFTL